MNPIRHNTSAGSARTTWRMLGLLLALTGIACLLLAGPLFVHTRGFAEKYLSPDQHITVLGIEILHQALMITGALLLAVSVSVVIWAAAYSEMISRLVVLYSNLTGRRFAFVLLWSSSITGLILVVFYLLPSFPGMNLLYGEDRLLETLTAILFIVSSFLIFGAAVFHRQQSTDHREVVAVFLVGIAIVFLFFGLEEISWGQRLFGWSTPVALEQINKQKELNVHNLSSLSIPLLYRWGTLAFVLVTTAGWLWLSRFKESTLRFLTPHGATAGLLVLILLFGVLWQSNELLEELGAVFALSYALAAIRASRPRHRVS